MASTGRPIIDLDTGEVIAAEAVVASNPWSRFRGLMLRGKLRAGEGLVIQPCSSIHMMFMRFRIDVVFFDREHAVTSVARNVPTWRGIAFGKRKTLGCIELPAGAAAAVEPGHRLDIAA
jgi:uncharacterized membrane protein (UPF0127 family)